MKSLLRAIPTLLLDAIGVLGAALVAYGARLVYLPAGYIAAGVLLLIGVWLIAKRG